MFNIILATDNKGGIGFKNKLPWYFSKDLKFFNNITSKTDNILEKSIVIMGRKTKDSIPLENNMLPNRINIIISKKTFESSEKIIYVNSLQDALNVSYQINSNMSNNIWVIGGSMIYEEAFYHPDLNLIYHTNIDHVFNCDTFIKLPNCQKVKSVSIIDKNKRDNSDYTLNFNILKPILNAEQKYLKLNKYVLINGNLRDTRNAKTISVFNQELSFDVSKSFPLLTTKKMFWRGIVEELLFFIRGETDTTILSQKDINIWKGNTTRDFLDKCNLNYNEGDMGPMYGYQWRFFNKPYNNNSNDKGIDQLKNLIDEIKANPSSRRLLMTDFNPSQVKEGVLYPCHSLILQFYVDENNSELSVKMYQRSADLFLGLPFNIASTSLLLYIIAKLTNLNPKNVSISLGDCHIYNEHIKYVEEQLSRKLYESPKLVIPDFTDIKSVEKSKFEDYELIDYQSHPSIKAKMIA